MKFINSVGVDDVEIIDAITAGLKAAGNVVTASPEQFHRCAKSKYR